MELLERQKNYIDEAKALEFFFNISSDKLTQSFKDFDSLYASTEHVTADEFIQSQNAINEEIESLCIANKISQEKLEELMGKN